jgi:hypothetical protein
LQPAHASSVPALSELRQILSVQEQELLMPVLAVKAAHVSYPAEAQSDASAQLFEA